MHLPLPCELMPAENKTCPGRTKAGARTAKKACFFKLRYLRRNSWFFRLQKYQQAWGPKVSKGSPESPLVAPAGAKPSALASMYYALCKKMEQNTLSTLWCPGRTKAGAQCLGQDGDQGCLRRFHGDVPLASGAVRCARDAPRISGCSPSAPPRAWACQ